MKLEDRSRRRQGFSKYIINSQFNLVEIGEVGVESGER